MTGQWGDNRGLALVSVLWVLSILSLIAAVVLASSSLSYRLSRNNWLDIKASSLVNVAVNRAVLGLLDQRVNERWLADRKWRSFEFEGMQLRVSIEDELGKIDLNSANDDLVLGLFRAVGESPSGADQLKNSVREYRQRETAKSDGSSSSIDETDLSHISARGFQSVQELRNIPDISSSLFLKLEPETTVYTGMSTIDPDVASDIARKALYGDTRVSNELSVALPSSSQISPSSDGSMQAGQSSSMLLMQGRAYTVRVEFDEAGILTQKYVVIRLIGDRKRLYWVLSRN